MARSTLREDPAVYGCQDSDLSLQGPGRKAGELATGGRLFCDHFAAGVVFLPDFLPGRNSGKLRKDDKWTDVISRKKPSR